MVDRPGEVKMEGGDQVCACGDGGDNETNRNGHTGSKTSIGVTGGTVKDSVVIGKISGNVTINQNQDDKVAKLAKRTTRKVDDWTKGMVLTEAAKSIVKKARRGNRWITVQGSPGEGKSTSAYLALKQLRGTGKDGYDIQTVEDYEAVKDREDIVLMLDDVFGQFKFDRSNQTRWEAVMRDFLNSEIHTESNNDRGRVVIATSRSNILSAAAPYLGKYKKIVLRPDALVDLSLSSKTAVSEDLQRERLKIWEHHAAKSNPVVDERVVKDVCRMKISHGFPHCCKLFAEVFHRSVDMETFFERPMEFLNETLESFMEEKEAGSILRQILKNDGSFDLNSIDDGEERIQFRLSVRRLTGSYLIIVDDVAMFQHPSIYDSAAFVVCTIDPRFVIENCSLQFLNERVRFERFFSMDYDSGLQVQVHQRYVDIFIERLKSAINVNNLRLSMTHESFYEDSFVTQFVQKVLPAEKLKYFIHKKDQVSGHSLLFYSSSSGSDKLLIYICEQENLSPEDQEDCLFGICEHRAGSSLRLFLRTFKHANLNCRNSKSETPLLVATARVCDQIVEMLISRDVDVCATDRSGRTALHNLCESGIERDESLVEKLVAKGADINISCERHPSLPLHIASHNGHLEIVKALCKLGAGISRQDSKGDTPLHYACAEGHPLAVAFLISQGADVDVKGNCGSTPLQTGAYWGHLRVVELLVDGGASINLSGRKDKTPIYDACQKGHAEIVALLADHGADINHKNNTGSTPLQEACYEGHVDAVEVLLQNNAAINIKDNYGRTPLHTACYRKKIETVAKLFSRELEIDVSDDSGMTPLHYACVAGEEGIATILLENGAGLNEVSGEGMLPLHYASFHGHTGVVKLFLSHKVDVHSTTTHGVSVLQYACMSGNKELVSLLLENKGDVNKADFHGTTPFQDACRCCSLDIVLMLLPSVIDLDKQDNEGRTSLHGACMSGHVKVAKLLLDKGLDANIGDKMGVTPLHYACCFGHSDVIAVLLNTDVNVELEDSRGNTVLHYLCGNIVSKVSTARDNLLKVEEKDVPAFVNKTNVDGNTALHALSPLRKREYKVDIIRFLLQNGADPDILNKDGQKAEL